MSIPGFEVLEKYFVIPAKAGIQPSVMADTRVGREAPLDSRLRGNDEKEKS
jgi:hypothetical protein